MSTRSEVIDAAACPACGARPGEPCRGVERRDGRRRQRKSAHAERWDAAGKTPRPVRDLERAERARRDREAIARLLGDSL
jgi:hypothetical protein